MFSISLGEVFSMKTATFLGAAWFAASLFAQNPVVGRPAAADSPFRSETAAAAYLDARMSWWMAWPTAARDHETFCVSCHTAVPYAMARPALRAALGEQSPAPVERKFLDNVTRRVRMWKEVEPFYPDATRGVPKTTESRGTESILNALIEASYNAPDTRLALDNMWAQQLKTGEAKGAWAWLQFHNSPWEGDSQYYGATLAAIAVGTAPGNYRDAPEIQDGMKLLREYLLRECASQVLIDRVTLLWASAKIPGLLTPAQQKAIADEALAKQGADGGFSLSSFVGAWKRHDNTPLETRSDGYATGIVAFALEQSGMPRDRLELKRALDWLTQNQDRAEGRWLAYSLNKQRDLATDVGKFMSDAATAYAVLALQSTH
jgi:squalene-hopene/tetraprenyl-beta-curcumene cyclase